MIVNALFFEFLYDEGPVLVSYYPGNLTSLPDTEENLAHFALPEGSHAQDEDLSYFILNGGEETLFGTACFRSFPDSSNPRGARQGAVAVVAKSVPFVDFGAILQVAAEKCLASKDSLETPSEIVRALYNSLNFSISRFPDVRLWDRSFPISTEPMAAISLTNLVRMLGVDIAWVWWAVMTGKGVLFLGPSARAVDGSSGWGYSCAFRVRSHAVLQYAHCLSAHGGLIAGTTNPLFTRRTERFDLVVQLTASASTAPILHNALRAQVTPSPRLRNFLAAAQAGIAERRGEHWLRRQFAEHTGDFLEGLRARMRAGVGSGVGAEAAISPIEEVIAKSAAFQAWVVSSASRPASSHQRAHHPTSPSYSLDETLAALQAEAAAPGSLGSVPLKAHLYGLAGHLGRLAPLERAVSGGVLEALAGLLWNPSNQVRKWALHSLSRLLLDPRAPAQLLSHPSGLLARAHELLLDPLVNVSLAAAELLARLAGIPPGRQALLGGGPGVAGCPQDAAGVVANGQDDIRKRILCAELLIHLLVPPAAPAAVAPATLSSPSSLTQAATTATPTTIPAPPPIDPAPLVACIPALIASPPSPDRGALLSRLLRLVDLLDADLPILGSLTTVSPLAPLPFHSPRILTSDLPPRAILEVLTPDTDPLLLDSFADLVQFVQEGGCEAFLGGETLFPVVLTAKLFVRLPGRQYAALGPVARTRDAHALAEYIAECPARGREPVVAVFLTDLVRFLEAAAGVRAGRQQLDRMGWVVALVELAAALAALGTTCPPDPLEPLVALLLTALPQTDLFPAPALRRMVPLADALLGLLPPRVDPSGDADPARLAALLPRAAGCLREMGTRLHAEYMRGDFLGGTGDGDGAPGTGTGSLTPGYQQQARTWSVNPVYRAPSERAAG
ncbi:hypothetical protein PAPYR_6350 [Paratrimastix pyriformis]|uniref:AVL9/DENND6 domain-containing protein n=1 Tax=Paratrimastix pyriformis TaxID=342808 RepID=A0ABQ8UH16_9EUKA|nr:hypothetical protein PAPYR_6350 [Paratrimastix pyriformis]